jgi:hypothetical protein
VDTDYFFTVGEANRENSRTNLTEAEVPLFAGAVRQVFCDDALRVNEGKLRQRE